jgi:hypothetical protein
MKRLLATIFCLLSGSLATSQTLDSALAFFPMAIGDKWQFAYYIISVTPGYQLGYYTLSVVGDTVLQNGKKYLILRQEPFIPYTTPFNFNPALLRIDSTNSGVYEGWPSLTSGEYLWDSLLARPGDISPPNWLTIRTDTILGTATITRKRVTSVFQTGFTLAYGIGPVILSGLDALEFNRISVLVYARIHGHEYGTLVSVNTTVQPNPMGFELSQNYPNPFNPSTTIRYALPQRARVALTVFNTLGQQVSTLVNGSEEAGYHDVRFDGGDLASGVYFYRLRAGGYVASKRLLLIR